MNISRRTTLALGAGALALCMAGPALAAGSTVSVSLWDKGDGSMDGLGMLPNLAPGMGGDMTLATMGITATPATVPAGEVTFEVTNDSKGTIHEMILSPLPADGKPLPYLADENRADEEKAGHLGEVSELDPGAKGALTVTLSPGTYLLYCNIPGHLVLGMWTTVKVE